MINGTAHPYEIVIKDSQSNPNRAAEVTQELILRDKVDVVTAFATPETVNPVSDQCELNGVPCITNDAPLEPYFFGRNGDPKKGFDWTFHFFWSGKSLVDSFVPHWQKLSQNKVMGVLWPNDGDGLAQARAFPPMFEQAGFKVVDPGRFDMPSSNYNAQISAFKAAGVEIVHAVVPPPEFTTFWNNAAQQNFHPKGAFAGKAMEFPAAVYPLGDRAAGLSVEVWWSRFHPYASGLTGQTAQELAAEYESSNNSQWSMPLGFRHSLFEVVFDACPEANSEPRISAASISGRGACDRLQINRRPHQFQQRAVSRHGIHSNRCWAVGERQEVAVGAGHCRQRYRARNSAERRACGHSLELVSDTEAATPMEILACWN